MTTPTLSAVCVRGCPRGVCYTSPFGQCVCSACGYEWPVDKAGDKWEGRATMSEEIERMKHER